MSRKLLLNSLSGTTLYAVNIVIAFIMTPVLIRALGNRDYGLWELVMSVIGYMGLLDLGIGGSLVRFVSVADGRQDKDDLQQTISTAFTFFAAVGAVAVVLFFALGYSPGLIAGSETKDIANLGTVFILLGVNAGMLFPLQVFIATLMGVQRHYFINNVRILLATVRACLTYYLLLRYQGRGLIILALLEPVFQAIMFVLFAGAVYLDRNIPKIALSAVTRSKAKEMITFGAKSATMMVASRLQNQSVPLIIGNTIGLGQIVYFVMPNRLVDYAKELSQAIGFPLTPYFGAAIGKGGDHDELVKSWLNITLALQIISLAIPVVIYFCGETFLRLWIGEEYAVFGRIVMYILLAGLVADSLATNAFRMLTAQGKHGRSALVWLVFSAVSIPVGIWGAHLWGIAGVAAGTTAVTVLANLLTVYMACSVMRIPLTTYFKKTTFLLLVPLLLLTISLWVIAILFVVKNYGSFIFQIFVSGSIYCIAVWRFVLTKETRGILSNRIHGFVFQQP
jgi:O-antigen/teichoic acid export membrane protein